LNETNGPAAVNSGTEGIEYRAGCIGTFFLSNAGPRHPAIRAPPVGAVTNKKGHSSNQLY